MCYLISISRQPHEVDAVSVPLGSELGLWRGHQAREAEAGHSWTFQGTHSSREHSEGTTVTGSSVYKEDPGDEQGG